MHHITGNANQIVTADIGDKFTHSGFKGTEAKLYRYLQVTFDGFVEVGMSLLDNGGMMRATVCGWVIGLAHRQQLRARRVADIELIPDCACNMARFCSHISRNVNSPVACDAITHFICSGFFSARQSYSHSKLTSCQPPNIGTKRSGLISLLRRKLFSKCDC